MMMVVAMMIMMATVMTIATIPTSVLVIATITKITIAVYACKANPIVRIRARSRIARRLAD